MITIQSTRIHALSSPALPPEIPVTPTLRSFSTANHPVNAVILNLGYKIPSEDMLSRAKQCFQLADVSQESYTGLCGGRGLSSLAKVSFCSEAWFNRAKLQIEAITFSPDGSHRTAFLVKARDELDSRARLATHRLHEAITELEAARNDSMVVSKVIRLQQVKVGGSVFVYSFVDGNVPRVQFESAAVSRYGEEVISRMKALALAR